MEGGMLERNGPHPTHPSINHTNPFGKALKGGGWWVAGQKWEGKGQEGVKLLMRERRRRTKPFGAVEWKAIGGGGRTHLLSIAASRKRLLFMAHIGPPISFGSIRVPHFSIKRMCSIPFRISLHHHFGMPQFHLSSPSFHQARQLANPRREFWEEESSKEYFDAPFSILVPNISAD